MAAPGARSAFLTEVIFKVLPRAERVATLVLRGLDDARGIEALSLALGSPFEVTGAAHLPAALDGRGPRTLMRIEGFAGLDRLPPRASCAAAEALRRRRRDRRASRPPRSGESVRDATRPRRAARARGLARLDGADRGPGRDGAGRARRSTPAGSTTGAAASIWIATPAAGDAGAARDPRGRCAGRRPRHAGARARRGPGRGGRVRAALGAADADHRRPQGRASIPPACSIRGGCMRDLIARLAEKRMRDSDQRCRPISPPNSSPIRRCSRRRRSCAPACIAASAPRPARPTCCSATSSTARAGAST